MGGVGVSVGFYEQEKEIQLQRLNSNPPPDLASNLSERFPTSNLWAVWLTQEIVPGSSLWQRVNAALNTVFPTFGERGRNEITMESRTLWNHAVLTVGDHSPWILLFKDIRNDDKPTGNHYAVWNSARILQRISRTHTLTSRFPSDFFSPFFLFSRWPQWIGMADFVEGLYPPNTHTHPSSI